MSKRTLLDLTQTILSSLNSDEVNSISDAVEAMQVAECIRTCYLNMMTRYDLPENNQLFQLTPSNDSAKPTVMYRPGGINNLKWIKYYNSNTEGNTGGSDFIHDLNLDLVSTSDGGSASIPGYQNVSIMVPEDFLIYTGNFPFGSDVNVETYTIDIRNQSTNELNTFTFRYRNDQQPQYCTIISDSIILFDTFDATQDATLQASKVLCYGWVTPEFLMEDLFVPVLDEAQFPLLLNEAKSLAFLELKQIQHPKADREIQKQQASLQKFKALSNKPSAFNMLPDFGRRGGRRAFRR